MNKTTLLFQGKLHAQLYSKYRPTYPKELSETIISHATNDGNKNLPLDHLLDLGCGNGQSTAMFLNSFRKITAVDPSSEQIKLAVKNNKFDHVNYGVGNAENIDLPQNSVDVISCGQCAHWFNLEKFFNECKRVLKPKGCLAIYGYATPNIKYSIQNESLSSLANKKFTAFYKSCDWHPNRSHIEDKYSRIYSAMPFAGKIRTDTMHIQREWGLDEFKGYIASWSGYQSQKKDKNDDKLDKFIDEIKDLWIANSEIKDVNITITWDIFLLMATMTN